MLHNEVTLTSIHALIWWSDGHLALKVLTVVQLKVVYSSKVPVLILSSKDP